MGRVYGRRVVFVAAFGGDVGWIGDAEAISDFLAFVRAQSVHVFVVVVGVVPDGSWRIFVGVDEELVMVSCVVLSDPSCR